MQKGTVKKNNINAANISTNIGVGILCIKPVTWGDFLCYISLRKNFHPAFVNTVCLSIIIKAVVPEIIHIRGGSMLQMQHEQTAVLVRGVFAFFW